MLVPLVLSSPYASSSLVLSCLLSAHVRSAWQQQGSILHDVDVAGNPCPTLIPHALQRHVSERTWHESITWKGGWPLNGNRKVICLHSVRLGLRQLGSQGSGVGWQGWMGEGVKGMPGTGVGLLWVWDYRCQKRKSKHV